MNTIVARVNIATRPGRVLVVDDEEKNRSLLKDSLEAKGYEVEEAGNGQEALDKIAARSPDAVLLDVMMPDMDGYEACRRMKANPATAGIPVLMITALSDRDERLNGIKEGASDFLTKPIDIQDVLLRVRNAVQSKRAFDQVQESNGKLEKQILRSDLTYRIIQELLAPLSSMMDSLDQLNIVSASKLEAHEHKLIAEARRGAIDLERTIQFILDVARLEAREMPVNVTACSLEELFDEVKEAALPGAVEVEPVKEKIRARCDKEITQRVLSCLAHNAVKLTGGAGNVRLKVSKHGGMARVAVVDNGPEIPAEYRPRIFSEFKRGEKHAQSHATGLGLTFCKLAMEAQSGRIGVEPNPSGGNIFWIELPLS